MTLRLTFQDHPRSHPVSPIDSPYMYMVSYLLVTRITCLKCILKDIQIMTLNLTSRFKYDLLGSSTVKVKVTNQKPLGCDFPYAGIQTKRLSPTIFKLYRFKEILTFDLHRIHPCIDWPQKFVDSNCPWGTFWLNFRFTTLSITFQLEW